MSDPPFRDPAVEAVFAGYPPRLRTALLGLRRLIFETAAATEGVGDLAETLKWRQPAYLTEKPRTGSTIRLDALKGRDDTAALFFHCQSRLVPTFRELYPDELHFEGNRALHLPFDRPPPEAALKHCIALALTYHLKRRAGPRSP